MIAVAHPGKLGDALYALPAVRYLSGLHGCQVDFWTSPWCVPLKGLLKAQSCIRDVTVAQDYKIKDHGCGTRPWFVPVEGEYETVYQLGFREYPDCFLADYSARAVGLVKAPALWLETRHIGNVSAPDDFTGCCVLCSKAMNTYPDWFAGFLKLCSGDRLVALSLPTLERQWDGVEDMTGPDLLRAAQIIAGARWVVGMPSIVQTIATFFPVKVACCVGDGHWDNRHLSQRLEFDRYFLARSDPESVLKWLEG